MTQASGQLQDRINEIERLIRAIEDMPDEKARQQTRDLVQAVLDVHGAGLERALEILYQSGPAGTALIDTLGEDSIVSNLLLLHGLHPLDLKSRIRKALESVKPRLGLHGGDVDLISVTPDGVVRLRLQGNCHGCPSSRVTLRSSIEEAVYAAAPDIVALEVEGAVDNFGNNSPNGAPPKFVTCPTDSLGSRGE